MSNPQQIVLYTNEKREGGSGRVWYTAGTTVNRKYLQALLHAEALHKLGIGEVHHLQPIDYYESLIKAACENKADHAKEPLPLEDCFRQRGQKRELLALFDAGSDGDARESGNGSDEHDDNNTDAKDDDE